MRGARPQIMLADQRFGRLLVLDEAPRRGHHRYWRCRCDCGREVVIAQTNLQRGAVASCGCLRAARLTTHGATASPEHRAWRQMRQRCHNPKVRSYATTGGRGIGICAAWEDFSVFLRDVGPRPTPRHRLIRRDLDGDFTPENCLWATEADRHGLQSSSRKRAHKP